MTELTDLPERTSILLLIRETQIEIIMRYHFIPTKMAIIVLKINKCCQGCRAIIAFVQLLGMSNGAATVKKCGGASKS